VKLPKIIFTLKIVAFFYIFITIFSCLLIPAAIDPEFGTWRGIEIHKNLLGHTSLMIFTLSLFFFSESNSKISKYFSITLLFLSIAIIILSGSSTNAIAFLVVSMIWFIKKIDKYFFLLGSSNLFSGIISFTVISAIIILLIYSNELLSLVPGLFGKDLTFTGRDVIWAFIWNEIQHKFWLGYGYGSYWIMGTSVIDLFQAYVGWLVNEAHNGFLEIMLQLGITGLSFFFFILLSFIHKIIKTADLIAFLALVSIIIVNFSESFIFQPRSPSTLVFILFYLLTNYNYQFLVKKTII
jgi:O-antigen ligase